MDLDAVIQSVNFYIPVPYLKNTEIWAYLFDTGMKISLLWINAFDKVLWKYLDLRKRH
jgi:hypothetical protein